MSEKLFKFVKIPEKNLKKLLNKNLKFSVII